MLPRKVQRQDLKTQVKEELLRHIRSMDLSVSRKLPREEQLCTLLGVSRITLRSVLDDLASEGIIFRRQGRGTFVNPSFLEIKVSFNPVLHFSDMITNSGYTPRTELIYTDTVSADESVAAALNMKVDAPVLKCVKIFFADDMVCSITEDYIPMEILGDFDLELFHEYEDSIFYYIYQKTGRKITWDKVEMNAVYSELVPLLKKELSRHGLQPKSYFLLNCLEYDEDDQPIAYCREYIDTDILKFNQIRKRAVNYDCME